MKRVWKGRLPQTDEEFLKFTTATDVQGFPGADYFLFKYEVEGTIAHVKMLIRQKIIKPKIGKKMIRTLKELKEKKIDLKDYEDVHSFVEDYVIRKTGFSPHIARSRNDQVILDERLFIKDHTKKIIKLLEKLILVLEKNSRKYKDISIPAFTHMQQAARTTFGHLLDSYIKALERDKKRFKNLLELCNENPLGAVAVAGTNLPIDRNYVAKLLKFKRVQKNTIDIVTNRWEFPTELISSIVFTYNHLSTIAWDMIYFNSLHLVEIGDEFCTGSSVMPHKKNPDFFELVIGKRNSSLGALTALIMSGGEFSGYLRLSQEVKWQMIKMCIEFEMVLKLFSRIIDTVKPNEKKFKNFISKEITSTELVNRLALEKNISFRKAYEVVAKQMTKLKKCNKI